MSGKRRKRHGPEQIVRKLRDADAMLNAGKDVAAVLQALEISEATYLRWRNQYGGMKSEEPALVKRILETARRRPRWGYRRVTWQLRKEAWQISDTRVYRLWRREGL